MNGNAPKQLTASERLDNLERSLISLYQTADNMARDVLTIKDAIKLLGNKVDAIVKASASGMTLNDENLAKLMIENNVAELKTKVENLVTQGYLAVEETVTMNSFVVGREVDDNGEVQNPRLQFAAAALQDGLREKLIDKKVGEKVVFEEGKLAFEVMEVYKIQTPTPEEAIAEENSGNDTDAPAAT